MKSTIFQNNGVNELLILKFKLALFQENMLKNLKCLGKFTKAELFTI